eukprot:599025-Rhodomonas_salina.3
MVAVPADRFGRLLNQASPSRELRCCRPQGLRAQASSRAESESESESESELEFGRVVSGQLGC